MSKSKKIVQRRNLCVASGKGKSGRQITVSMIDPYIDTQPSPKWPFFEFVRGYDVLLDRITEPKRIDASMCPAKFAATGFDFDVEFDVGVVKHKTGQKESGRYAITRLQLGTTKDAKTAVDPSVVYAPMLLRLALEASSVTGIAYPAGWTVDIATGEYLGTLRVGDRLIPDSTTYGVKTKREQRELTKREQREVRRLFSKVPKLSNDLKRQRVWKTRIPVVSELTGVEVLLKSVGRKASRPELDRLTGKNERRTRRAESMSDPAMLNLVAKLYDSFDTEQPVGQRSRVEWVRSQLEVQHRIFKSASWVRQVAKVSRDEGILKTGRRKTNKKRTRK